MKKSISLIVCALLTTKLLMAQFESFDLKKYKLPEIKRKQLDLSLNLNESYHRDNTKIEDQDLLSEKNFLLEGYTYVSYSGYQNSKRLQSSQNISVTFSPSFQRNVNHADQKTKNSRISPHIYVSSMNRIYFRNKYFFQPGVIFSGALDFYKSSSESENLDRNTDITTVNFTLPLMAGKGRIEPVQDARLAVYILDELNKKGSLARIPNEAEILQFAALISRLKNERFFDFRIKRIYEIEKVDSFLQATGMKTITDAKYFTTITDNWDYSSGPVRESGNRFSIGVVPSVYFHNSFEKRVYEVLVEKDHIQNYTMGAGLEMGFISAKPLSLKWQRTWNLGLAYVFEKETFKQFQTDDEIDFNNKEIEGHITYRWEYLPNSRTNATGQFSCFINRTQRDSNFRFVDVNPDLNLTLNYYISPQLRFTCQYGATYLFGHDNVKFDSSLEFIYTKHYGLRQFMNASFTYSFL